MKDIIFALLLNQNTNLRTTIKQQSIRFSIQAKLNQHGFKVGQHFLLLLLLLAPPVLQEEVEAAADWKPCRLDLAHRPSAANPQFQGVN